jgi:hypothetical protein
MLKAPSGVLTPHPRLLVTPSPQVTPGLLQHLPGKSGCHECLDSPGSRGLCLVQLCIAPSLLWRIQGCTTLYQAWRKLRQAYQPNTCASRVHCIKQLTALQLSKSSNVQEHVAALSELLNRLAGLHLSFHNDVRCSLLLTLLPES